MKWLTVVVDNKATMTPYWPKIVSDHLVKIVRGFCGNSQEKGATTGYQLGLVLYNANSDLGHKVQYIDWTKDVDYFLGRISCLTFYGDDSDDFTMAKGLAEALLMYPRPSNATEKQEYYNGERHCIVVSVGDPVPRRILVSVPRVRYGEIVGQNLVYCKADFLEVAQLFGPLAVSLSVITPSEHPIYRTIFNLGNNISERAYDPFPNDRVGPFTILLSTKFKEACDALHDKRSEESITTTTNFTFPTVDTSNIQVQENLFSAGKTTTIAGQTTEAARDTTDESLPGVPNATHDSSSSSHTSMNVFDDIMAELTKDKYVILPSNTSKAFIPLEEHSQTNILQPDQLPFHVQEQTMSTKKQISKEALRTVESESEQALRGTAQDTSKTQTSINDNWQEVRISPLAVPSVPTPGIRIGSKRQRLERRDNPTILNSMLISENSSNSTQVPVDSSSLSLVEPQAWYKRVQGPSGMTSTAVRLGIVDPWETQTPAGSTFGNSMFPHATGNTVIQFQSNSSPSLQTLPNSSNQFAGGPSGSFSGQQMEQYLPGYQYQRDPMSNFAPLHTSAVGASTWVTPVPRMPQTTHAGSFLPHSFVLNFQDYMHTWEGSLSGKIYPNSQYFYTAKAFRRTASPLTLTVHWPNRLMISHYIPRNAISHTKSIIQGPVEDVFFNIAECNNLDLHEHLMSKNLCAKIDLPSQTLILSPISSIFYVGTVFPEDTVFVEPA